MKTRFVIRSLILGLVVLLDTAAWAQSGAKALFYEGGSSLRASVAGDAPRRSAGSDRAYMGVSYWVELVDRSGEARRVTSDHAFNPGDRIRLHVTSNRDGYLTLVNFGSSGQRTVLVPSPGAPDNYVRAFSEQVVPTTAFLRFDETPGVEVLQLALSPRPTGLEMPAGLPQPPGAMPPMGAPGMPQGMPPGMMAGMTPGATPGAMPGMPPSMTPPATGMPTGDVPLGQPGMPMTPAAFPGTDAGGGAVSAGPSARQPDPRVASATGDQISAGLLDAVAALNREQQGAKGAKDLVMEVDAASAQPASYAVLPMRALMDGSSVNLQIQLRHR